MRNYEGLCGPRKTWEDGKLSTPLRRYTPPFGASVAMGICPRVALESAPLKGHESIFKTFSKGPFRPSEGTE